MLTASYLKQEFVCIITGKLRFAFQMEDSQQKRVQLYFNPLRVYTVIILLGFWQRLFLLQTLPILLGLLGLFFFFLDFIYLFIETHTQREAETQAEGEAGSMQRA